MATRYLIVSSLIIMLMTTVVICEAEDAVTEEVTLGPFSDFIGQLSNVPRPFLSKNAARVNVNGGEFVAYTSHDGSFTIHHLPPGAHLLDIELQDFVFPPIRLDVSHKKKNRVRAVVNDGSQEVLKSIALDEEDEDPMEDDDDDDEVDKAESEFEDEESVARQKQQKMRQQKKRLQKAKKSAQKKEKQPKKKSEADNRPTSATLIPAVGQHQFFVPRETYNLMSFVKNPMVIMMGVTVLLAWMAKQMPQDEMKRQMRDMSATMQGHQDQAKAVLGGGKPDQPKVAGGAKKRIGAGGGMERAQTIS